MIVILLLSALAQPSIPSTVTVVGEPGDICSPEEPCIAGTICDSDNLCSCPDPHHQLFDHLTKHCLSKVNGGTCTTSTDCTPNAACILKWNSSSGHFDGTCHCIAHHFVLPFDFTCSKLATHGEPCYVTINDLNYRPCDQNLECVNSTCRCERNLVYDVQLKTCAIRAGDSCYSHRTALNQMCVSGAKCRHHGTSSGAESRKAKLRCRCDPGWVENGNGFCQPSYGQSCSDLRPCFSTQNVTATELELICAGGRCQCSSPLYQIFDPKSHKCMNRVGSPCFKGQTICVPHADCTDDAGESDSALSNAVGTCKCSEGYSVTSEGTCKLTFRMNCNTSNGTKRTEGQGDDDDCNADAGLTCDDGSCNCFDNYLAFDPTKGVCVNRLGGFCGTYKDPKSGRRFSVGCSGSAETKCIKHYVGSGGVVPGSACFCSQDVKSLYPPKQYCTDT